MIIAVFLMAFQGVLLAQTQTDPSVHSTCATAAKVCGVYQVYSASKPNQVECIPNLMPQYFKFKMLAPGNIDLNTNSHAGNYTLYGPLNSTGLTACQQISMGQVNQVSGSLSGAISIAHIAGDYILRVNPTSCSGTGEAYRMDISVSSRQSNCKDEQVTCKDCIGSFSPEPGQYLVSAWVKGEAQHKNTSYVNPSIGVTFSGAANTYDFQPSGLIIDEWQRIDGVVTILPGATEINIALKCAAGKCFFDDIRFIPMDGSMISYVYDPVNLRLVAQLDERNFATFYEYDEQGKLIRTKKETERGIMTIQESRDNIYNK